MEEMENKQYYLCLVTTFLNAAGQVIIPENPFPVMNKNAMITYKRALELVPDISDVNFKKSSEFKNLLTPESPYINVCVGSEFNLVQMLNAKEIQKWFRCLFINNHGPKDPKVFWVVSPPL